MNIGDGFTGQIDEVSIWEDALSDAEREALRLGETLNTGGLVGYWAFDEGSGTTATDSSENGNDGTLTNFNLDSTSGWAPDTIEQTEDSTSTTDPLAIWNPTQTYTNAGEYSATLRVKGDSGRWSTTEETTITIVDGSIAGKINAADLRTPVDGVTLTLTSAHVLDGELSSLVTTRPNLDSDDEGGVTTTTGTDGTYTFTNLPLGTYRIVATKADAVDLDGDDSNGLETVIHEFETPVKVATLNTSLPNQKAVDFVDLSVFPVGGKIRSLPWDLADTDAGEQPDEPNDNLDALLIEGVVIEAKPLGGTSSVESDPSDSTADATGRNYSLPMFAGRYQFFARLGDRDVRLDENVSHETLYTVEDESETSAVRIVTINGATAGMNFVDHTVRTLTITVEDSGGNPISTLVDDGTLTDYQEDNNIEVDAILSGGAATATNSVVETTDDGGETITVITYELPPGQYTLEPESTNFSGKDIVFENPNSPDELLSTLTVDLTVGDGTATMVVPVQIELAIGPGPNLMDLFDTDGDGSLTSDDDAYTLLTSELGLDDDAIAALQSGLQDYMYYNPAGLQTHIYAIQATANGHPVEDFNLFVEDELSLLADGDATEQNVEIATLFNDDDSTALSLDTYALVDDSDSGSGPWTIPDGLVTLFLDEEGVSISDTTAIAVDFDADGTDDGWTVTDDDGRAYFLQEIDADGDAVLHVSTGGYAIVGGLPATDGQSTPTVVAKTIAFTAKKDRYADSDEVSTSVTVLGDRLQGTAAQIVAVPNVNYLVLHDPPGDNSYAYLEDNITLKGIVSGMTIRGRDQDIPVFPAPWTTEREIWDATLGGGVVDDSFESDLGSKGLLNNRDDASAFTAFTVAAVVETVTGVASVALSPPVAYAIQVVKGFMGGGLLTGENTGLVQYEVNAGRRLETASGDDIPDLIGPGRGDIYYGEGWTLGFQDRFRFGLTFDGENWATETTEITTYDLLDRSNQYVYTTRDIENIIDNLDNSTEDRVLNGQNDWMELLEKNKAYKWSRFYLENGGRDADTSGKVHDWYDSYASEWQEHWTEVTDVASFKAYLRDAANFASVDALESNLDSFISDNSLSTLEGFILKGVFGAAWNIENNGGTDNDVFKGFRVAEDLPEDTNKTTASINSSGDVQDVETLIFSAGPAFEYTRTISEGRTATFTTSVEFETEAKFASELKSPKADSTGTFTPFCLELSYGFNASTGIQAEQGLSGEWQSGKATEQAVGFVLQDDNVGDNIATRVYEDPIWGTPLFIHDAGSVTSDPWEPGTNKAVEVALTQTATKLGFLFGVELAGTEAKDTAVAAFDSNSDTIPDDASNDGVDLEAALITNGLVTDDGSEGAVETIDVSIEVEDSRWSVIVQNAPPDGASDKEYLVRVETTSSGTWVLNVYEETTSTGPFDYHAGAHYRMKVDMDTFRNMESDFTTTDFLIYAPEADNLDNVQVKFNGQPDYQRMGLTAEADVANVVVSVYPPEVDKDNSYEKEYSVLVFVQEEADAQINSSVLLTPRFADLSPPETQITSPYEGQRISPVMFGFDGDSGTTPVLTDAFTIQVVSDAPDIDSIQIQSRTKLQNGVWSSWTQLGDTNGSVVTWSEDGDTPTGLGGEPMRRPNISQGLSRTVRPCERRCSCQKFHLARTASTKLRSALMMQLSA